MDSATGKRLVIFGCGYIGGELARRALAAGAQVTALTRNAQTAAELEKAGARAVVAELAETAWHGEIPGGVDWVVNTVSSGGGGVEGYRRSYVGGMRSILAWARTRGAAGTLVYTSSTSVYPQGGGAVVEEDASVGGSERAEILVEAERIAREGSGGRMAGVKPAPQLSHGMAVEGMDARDAASDAWGWRRFFVLRLAGIYGPGRHHLLEQARAGEVAGVGGHRLNLIHRDDVCAAIAAVLGAPAEVRDEIFNVTDDEAGKKEDVVRWLAARIGAAEPVFTGEPAGGRRIVTPDRVIANAKLKARLGWRPRFPDFRAGYENVLAAEAK